VLPLQRINGYLSGLATRYSFRLRPVASPGADIASLLTALARVFARRRA
jgi:hypothetical protein